MLQTRSETPRLNAEELERMASDSEGGPPPKAAGWLGAFAGATAFGLSAYALYWTQFAVNTALYRASFLAIGLSLVFLLYPFARAAAADRTRRAGIEDWATIVLAIGFCGALVIEADLMARDPASCLVLAPLAGSFALQPFAARSRLLAETRLLDWALAGIAVYCALYLALNLEEYKNRATRPSPEEIALGGALILLVLEATRRTVGWMLPAITAAFLVYCHFGPSMPEPFDHRGFSFARIIGQNYLTLEGVFSTPMDVAATFIILFAIYGAVLERGGAGRFFIEWAFALFGKKPSASAPGRAVAASGFLLGTVSGSGVATTVTIASLAWPMLRRSGYPPHVAGGMISAAGIGATLSPPTLGAAAFIIAEYLEVSYLQILLYASIPTLLYYLSCWLTIEADARRLKVRAVKTSDASLWSLTRDGGYHFLSLVVIVGLLALGYTPFLAVFWSIAVAFGLSMIRADNRLVSKRAFAWGLGGAALAYLLGVSGAAAALGLGPWFDDRASVAAFWGMAVATAASSLDAARALRRGAEAPPETRRMIDTLTEGGRSILGVTATCACAGIIVSVINLTGLGLTLSSIIVELGAGGRLTTIVLTAVAMWVLGTAVPVTASYIIAAVMLVPALIQVGAPEPAAHMFIFYYAVLADVSPPTALAPFAAAAITGARPFPTLLQAWKYTLPAFLVPFLFCLTPEGLRLLMLTPENVWPTGPGEWMGVVLTSLAACVALVGLAFAATGYGRGRATAVERALSAAGAALVVTFDPAMLALGAACLTAAFALHWARLGPAAAARGHDRVEEALDR